MALNLAQVFGLIHNNTSPVIEEVFPHFDLDRCDQMRVLICDGPILLAWVGTFRPEAFTQRERALLTRLIPALQQRLKLESQLGDSALHAAALSAAMEAISSESFVVSGNGSVKHANAAGAQLLESEPEVPSWIRYSLQEKASGRFAITKLQIRGAPDHYLAVLRRPSRDWGPQIVVAAARWQLTAKQTRILGLLVRGAANKTIAALLDCSEGTVEFHVTALLAKAQVGSRSELVARFWIEA